MKDIKLTNIQPVGGQRQPDKAGSKQDPQSAQKFQKEMTTALSSAESKSIEDRAKALEHQVSQTGNQIKSLNNGMQSLLSQIKQMRDTKNES